MLLGKELGPYVVEKELGAGAMGAVFRARHQKSGQRVAIKIIAPGLAASDAAMVRFKREISILKQLEHPNIVRLIASGKISGSPFYVMEYIEGESLDRVMERRGRLTWEELVTLGQQLCAALQYAHDKGIIHRDLKPSNLMVLKDGTVKLTDFGIAKDTDVTALTAANSTVGTAAYMSPEQCRGVRDLTHKSDLYSMGVMFYELVTGRKPFYAESALEMFNKHLSGTFERPSRLSLEIPVWLDTLICQLMEKDPDKRPFNAETVSQSLEMVREKVAAQVSAGIDAAKKRRADKTDLDVPLDETDKEAARTLLGKKKKKKKVAFYRQGWFTVLSVTAILGALAFVTYLAFFRVPSAEEMYAQAEHLLKAGDEQSRKEGRATIATFFEYYKDDARAAPMQAWADAYDLERYERIMERRRKAKIRIDEKDVDAKAEELAREALDYEDRGRLDDAAETWQKLKEYKGNANPELHAWGLVGEKYLRQVQEIDKLYQELAARVAAEKETGEKASAESKAERLALEALRKDQPASAMAAWTDLKSHAQDSSENRRWFLLAAKMEREWSEKK